MNVTTIMETCLFCRDLEAAENFYSSVLGCRVYSKQKNRHVFFRLSSAMLLIFNPDITMALGEETPPHGAFGEGHIAFRISEADYEKWKLYLKEKVVVVEKEIDWPSGGRSLYFRDPDKNSVELATPKIWNF